MTESSPTTAPTGLRRFSALTNLSLFVPSVLFAILGLLLFGAAVQERRHVTTEYESLVKSQQAAIDSLSDALSACNGDDTSDEPAASRARRGTQGAQRSEFATEMANATTAGRRPRRAEVPPAEASTSRH